MLFMDGEKFSLEAEDLNQLKSVFPDFMLKNKSVRITHNGDSVRKLQTNNPIIPMVFAKPKHGMLLFHNFVDPVTGEQREIRFSDGPPQFKSNGRKVFGAKSMPIDSNFIFDPRRHKELLWFVYNFSGLFANGLKGRHSSPYKFLMIEREATEKANAQMAEARAKVAIANMTKEQLIAFAKSNVGVNAEDTKELIIARIYSAMDKKAEYREYVIDTLTPPQNNDILDIIEKAWNLDRLVPSMDGTQTILIYNGKEVTLADLPVDDKQGLADFLSKDKKALNLVKKAIS
jgi:hypothetical protein